MALHKQSFPSLVALALATNVVGAQDVTGTLRLPAVISDHMVLQQETKVIKPIAVRYAWANNPEGCNLYNREGLPASPFRSDNWPGITDHAHLEEPPLPQAEARRSAPVPNGDFEGNVLNITLGKTLERPWEEVKMDGYDYAPEQESLKTGETRVWLPFGNAKGVYYSVDGFVLTDTAPNAPATAVGGDSGTDGSLIFKFRFDKPVASFRFRGGRCDFNPQGAVMGFEYSVDGKKWTPLCETGEGGLHELFPKPEAASANDLSTQDLYLRFSIRNATAASHVRFRMGGDPKWGDASYTFHAAQWQLWLTPVQ